MNMNPDRTATQNGVVLVVDDAPDTLGLLCHTLEAAGYTTLMASSGQAALERLEWVSPDAILLDAMMPGLSGFETCKHIKSVPGWHHIPIIFMTGLSDVEHLVQGFESGGVDYVVKPVRSEEVLARLTTHVRNAKATRLARQALDIEGFGVVLLDTQGRVAWRSPKAQAWLDEFFPDLQGHLPASWMASTPIEHDQASQAKSSSRTSAQSSFTAVLHHHKLQATRLGEVGFDEILWLLHRLPVHQTESVSRLKAAELTTREAEVLSWLAKGKTNRDIGDILGMSPRTVNKHLEHIYEKLGVETRTAAAALASRELS
jgi:DNA-binding NarL/FixJ family response regulator